MGPAVDALRAYLTRAYDREQYYVLPLSAGYDTRILLVLLRAMEIDWHNVAMVSWEPECRAARQVVDLLGLDIAHPRYIDGKQDYWRPTLVDQVALGASLGDPNRWMSGFNWLARLQVPPGARQITALWDDEMCGWNQRAFGGDTLLHATSALMLEQSSPLADRASREVLAPFAGCEYLKFLCRFDLRAIEKEPNVEEVRIYTHYSQTDTLKRHMLRILCPEALSIPNPRYAFAKYTRAGGVIPHMTLSEEARGQLAALHPDGKAPPDRLLDPYDPWIQRYQWQAMVVAAKAAGVEVVL